VTAVAVVDSTVIVHLFRRYEPAWEWYADVTDPLAITPVSWMEVIVGAGSKVKQAACKEILQEFQLMYLTEADQDWAIEQLERFRLSHGATINDCLIASVCHRLQIPLFTQNLKDMTPMIGDLAVKPYA
jgi:hypothetical protein